MARTLTGGKKGKNRLSTQGEGPRSRPKEEKKGGLYPVQNIGSRQDSLKENSDNLR